MAVTHMDQQLPVHLSSSPNGAEENSITVLEGSGGGREEMKKIYPQHHQHHPQDHNNNNGNVYQNLTPIHSNHHVKSEAHSPIATNKLTCPGEAKSNDSHLGGNSDSSSNPELTDMGSERPRCWMKI